MRGRVKAPALALAFALGWGSGAAAHGATLCTATVSQMVFGLYDTISPVATDTTASVQVSCTPGVSSPLTTSYVVTIAGTGSGNDSVRAISNGAYLLYYQVHSNAARSVVWGNGGASGAGVAGSVTASAALVPASQTHTAYGRLAARQAVPPGVYGGTLLVTVDY
jgi:spore coat protein U-like protein